MKRSLPRLLSGIPVAILLLALAVPAQAQRPYDNGYGPPSGPPPGPSLDGIWYNRANDGQCQIIQRGPDRAVFINENGSRAGGRIDGDRVYIPDWQDGYGRPLMGRLRGDRIVWPDGNYWYR
jgi:hypothetical protein